MVRTFLLHLFYEISITTSYKYRKYLVWILHVTKKEQYISTHEYKIITSIIFRIQCCMY